ncbi:mannonate dehydratase [Paraburkholderia sp.]|uniref:mannonate dehydratase n=1 Tax=Paraburkholderia sp. TaxID=1926495 RepID=UPI003C7E30A9
MGSNMNRREFGKNSVIGAAALSAGGIARASTMTESSTSDPARRSKPTIRVGGDYHAHAGPSFLSRENIEYNLRFGVKHLTINLAGGRSPLHGHASTPRIKSGWLNPTEPWDVEALKRTQEQFNASGIKIEGARMDSAYIIMKAGSERDRYLDVIRNNIRKAGEAGIELVNYHWTMIPIRRNGKAKGRGGSVGGSFRLESNWGDLPPTEAGIVSSDEYWERIDYFLKGVIPVARESKVKMAVHPYDPGGLPLGYQGVDNWDAVDFVAGMKKYELLYDDIYNGFQYDTGVAGESLPDPNSQIDLLRYLVERGKVHQIHFRNVRGRQNDFVETYPDEGDVNLFNVVRLLRDLNWQGSLLPDHSPTHVDDPGSLQGYAFAYGYIAAMIQAAYAEI